MISLACLDHTIGKYICNFCVDIVACILNLLGQWCKISGITDIYKFMRLDTIIIVIFNNSKQ